VPRDHTEHDDAASYDSVDDPVVLKDQLAIRLVIDLGHSSTELRMVSKAFSRRKDASDEKRGTHR